MEPISALIAALGTLGAAGVNSYSAYSGAAAQRDWSDRQMELERIRRDAFGNIVFNSMRGSMPDYSNIMKGLPDAGSYFGKSNLDPSQYFSTDTVNKNYDQAIQNLNRLMGSKMGSAAKMAGEQAAARGMTNPGGYTNMATQGVQESFAPQFGQLESSRANAMQDMLGKQYGALFGQQQFNAGQGANMYNALMGQKQMQTGLMQNQFSNQSDLMKLLAQIQFGG